MGMTPDGQFFLSYHVLNAPDYDLPMSQGSLRPFGSNLGHTLSIIACLNYPLDPQLQWVAPALTYAVPVGIVDGSTVPNYEDLSKIVLNIFDYSPANTGKSALFTKVS